MTLRIRSQIPFACFQGKWSTRDGELQTAQWSAPFVQLIFLTPVCFQPLQE